MAKVLESIEAAVRILRDNETVLRNDAGLLAHNGDEGRSVDLDHAATYIDAALTLITKAATIIAGKYPPYPIVMGEDTRNDR